MNEEQEFSEAPNCWFVRAGRHHEAVEHNLANDVVTIGFGGENEYKRVLHHESLAEFRIFIDERIPDWRERYGSKACEQIWRFARKIERNHLVVMPMRRMGPLAIGRIEGPYLYESSQLDYLRQRRSVTWLRIEIERADIEDDLRESLGLQPTVFELRRHDAARRICHLAEHGVDPGLGCA